MTKCNPGWQEKDRYGRQKEMEDIASIIQADQYNIPTTCAQCGGVMVFKGVGEYQCEVCGEVA